MDFPSLFKNQSEYWSKCVLTLSPADIKRISGKDTKEGRMTGFLTKGYLNREKLIKNGEIVFAYCFRIYREDAESKSSVVSSLFSPSKAINEDPMCLLSVYDELSKACADKNDARIPLKLRRAVLEPSSDFKYLELPSSITDGKLVYLSSNTVFNNTNPDLGPGINAALMNKKISNELVFLPPQYWIKEYAEYKKAK